MSALCQKQTHAVQQNWCYSTSSARESTSVFGDRCDGNQADAEEAAQRTIPLPPPLVSALREWKLACPIGPLGLVFPNGIGRVEFHVNLLHRLFWPLQIAAGIVCKTVDEHGEILVEPKYPGLHSLRHFYASWCANRKVDGGLELTPKLVQTRLGHGSIQVTMDRYSHLFPSSGGTEELAKAANFLLA